MGLDLESLCYRSGFQTRLKPKSGKSFSFTVANSVTAVSTRIDGDQRTGRLRSASSSPDRSCSDSKETLSPPPSTCRSCQAFGKRSRNSSSPRRVISASESSRSAASGVAAFDLATAVQKAAPRLVFASAFSRSGWVGRNFSGSHVRGAARIVWACTV